jgi:hypothetical protein
LLWRAEYCLAASMAHGLREALRREALLRSGRRKDGRWVVWVVGARESMEGELARRGLLGGPFAALCGLPDSVPLQLILIGPEMDGEWEHADGAVHVTSCRATLHEWLDGAGKGARCDGAVLPNSGVGTLSAPIADGWLPSLEALLAMGVPTLLTCFDEGEARGESEVLAMYGAHVFTPPRRNPFAHACPPEALEHTARKRRERAVASAITAATGNPNARVGHAFYKLVLGTALDAAALRAAAPRVRALFSTMDASTQLMIDAYEEWRHTGSAAAADRLRQLMGEHLPSDFVEQMGLPV